MRTAPLLVGTLTAVGSLLVGTTAYAAGGHAHAPRSITVTIGDPAGDARGEQETDTVNGSIQTSTVDSAYHPTAAESALDLTGLDLKVVRSGHRPTLRLAWHVAGPLPSMHRAPASSWSGTSVVSILAVAVSHTPLSIMVDDIGSTGVQNLATGKAVECRGFAVSAPAGGTVVTATVPLACLQPGAPAKKGGDFIGSLFNSMRAKVPAWKAPAAVQVAASSVYESVSGTESDSVSTVVHDRTRASRTLNLTPQQ